MAQRRILLDIDGTIGDIRAQFWQYCHKDGLRPSVPYEDFQEGHGVYAQVPGLTRAHITEGWFQQPEFWREMPLLPGAAHFLKLLADLGSIHIVTARHWYDRIEADTALWLRKHNIPFASLHCVSCDNAPCEKAEVARREKLTVAIEDSLHNSQELGDCNIPVAVFAPSLPVVSLGTEAAPLSHCRTYGEVLKFVGDTPGSVPDKQTFYRLFSRNWFGNAGLNFPNWWEASDYARLTGQQVAIRLKPKKTGGAPFYPNLDPERLVEAILDAQQKGFTLDEMQFSAMMPDKHITLQGYVQRSINYLDLDYNDVPTGANMREAMKTAKHTSGLKALSLLRTHLDPSDFDDLMGLFDAHPDDVIEFSAYSIPCGDLNRHCVFWEVRAY